MKKTIILTILFLLLLPTFALADEFGASSGLQSRQAAIVGKVICKSDITEQYIVYGRLSLVTSQGFRVYEAGKFFYVTPTDQDSKRFIEQRIGQGVKAFGQLELMRGAINSEILYSNRIIEYKPEDDLGVMEPAYGAIGPHKWIGFGVAQDQYRVSSIKLDKSTDAIKTLVNFTTPLLQEGRTIRTEHKGGEAKAVFYEPKTKKVFELEDVVSALIGTKSEFTPEKKDFLAPIRTFWQANIKQSWLIEKGQAAHAEMSRALRGYIFITGQSGKVNNLMEGVPVLRPDIDKFMSYIESKRGEGFSKWASPAVFYGKISGKPSKYTYLLTTPVEVESKYKDISYINPTYTGPYFAENNPESLVEHIVEIKNDNILEIKSKDPSQNYRDIEIWPIGYPGEGSLYKGFTADQYAHYAGQNVWMTGSRVLVYKIVSCDEEGCSTSYSHIEYGDMEEGTFTNGKNTTTVTLVGHYIKPEHIITKPQYNLLLDLIKELVFKGGV